jgi:hypothetical protein
MKSEIMIYNSLKKQMEDQEPMEDQQQPVPSPKTRKCKFTEINAMANLAASSAGVDEAEAVVP